MRTIHGILLLSILGVSLILDVQGASLSGVTLPDTVEVGTNKLVLNGMGLRKKYFVEVYVGGLYLANKSSDGDAILNVQAPKQMTMHFVRDVSKAQLMDAFEEAFKNNVPDATKTLKSEIDQLANALDSVKTDDEMTFIYQPGSGTRFSLNSKPKVNIENPAFGRALFLGWLGPKPPTAELKNKLLGK